MLSTLLPIMSSPDTEGVFEGERKLLLTSKNSAKEKMMDPLLAATFSFSLWVNVTAVIN